MAYRNRLIVSRCALLVAVLSCAVPAATVAQQTGAPKAAKTKQKAAPASEGAQKLDVAGAQAAIDSAGKLIAAGKTEPAVSQLTTVISSGNMPAAVMAKALYMRGTAYRQQQKPALAIADLTSALWLKGGLNDADRADATQQRAAAYSDAGLNEQGQAIATTSKAKHAAAAADTPAPAQSSGGLFAGLFGGNNSSAAPKTDVPKPQPAAPAKAANWSAATKPAPAAPAAAAATAPAAATTTIAVARAPAPAAPSVTGHTFTRVALVRTQTQAQAVIAKLKQEYAAALGNHTADIGQATFGNMGSFFEVAVGPFQSAAEAQALCGKLKGSGLDCVPVTR